MPGIKDAEIRTKSDTGALREAKVNFVCFNKRQLDVLELLYMRVGYVVCLEWGWNPYISNSETRETNDFTVKNDFFNKNKTIEDINETIRKHKIESGANYDGFIGYVKNFTYKAREDGGYDCTTEIIAHGEILESLQSPAVKTNKKIETVEDPIVEYEDRFLFYLRSIKATLNGAGEQFFLSRFMSSADDGQLLSLDGGSAVNNYSHKLIPPQTTFKIGGQVIDIPGGAYDVSGGTNYADSFYSRRQNLQDFKAGYQSKLNDLNDPRTAAYFQKTSIEGDIASQNMINVTEPTKYEGTENLVPMFEVQDPNNPNETVTIEARMPTDEELGQMNPQYASDYYLDTEGEIQYGNVTGFNNYGQNSALQRWNYYVQLKTQELNLNSPVDYRLGFRDLVMLYHYINKNSTPKDLKDNEKVFDPLSTNGFESILGGAILKQTVKYNASLSSGPGYTLKPKEGDDMEKSSHIYDSGYRRNIYVRWDLICQMLNHLSQKDLHELSSTIDSLYDIKDPNQRGLQTPLVEFTYAGPNQRTWNNNRPEDGRSEAVVPNVGRLYYLGYGPCRNTLADPAYASTSPEELKDKYHPVIGNSFNERVCLLPHMAIFDDMFDNDKLKHQKGIEIKSTGATYTDYGFAKEREERVGFNTISSFKTEQPARNMRNSIGFIYFNLDFLISTYESLRLKSTSGERLISNNAGVAIGTLKIENITLNKKFALFDYVKELWEGVNDVTANYYNFKVFTEHEKANKIKIVDMRLSGLPDEDDLYEFEPQGLKSITRQFYFDSKIDADIASAISIAAQAPNSQQSLESLSFKAFHKDIKSRFNNINADVDTDEIRERQKEKLKSEILDLNKTYTNLTYYLQRLKAGNFGGNFHIITPDQGIKQAVEFIDLRRNILNKYPLYTISETLEKKAHPKAGQWREGTTTDDEAIIPLQCSFKLDGISGMIPLQLFKIHKDKLPFGYQRDNIAFVTSTESQTITADQDWTTDITGKFVLLNKNPNNSGVNNILDEQEPNATTEVLNNPEFDIAFNPYADFVREVSQLYGHQENDYSKSSPIGNGKGDLVSEGYYDGELSSHDDIKPEMAAIAVILMGCMNSESYCNDIVWGPGKWGKHEDDYSSSGGTYDVNGNFITTMDISERSRQAQALFDSLFEVDQTDEEQVKAAAKYEEEQKRKQEIAAANKTADYVYENGNRLKDVKITWTAGNDKEHQKPKYKRSRHRDGQGLDFIFRSPSPRITSDLYGDGESWDPKPKLYNNGFVDWDSVVAEEQSSGFKEAWSNPDVWKTGQHHVHPKHVYPIPEPEKFYNEERQNQDQIRWTFVKSYMDRGRFETKLEYTLPEAYGNFFEPSKDSAVLLNSMYKLCCFLRIIFPNLIFIDEYRKPGRTATGLHWHISGWHGKTTPVCTVDRAKSTGGKIWVNEIYGGQGGYVPIQGTRNDILVGQ